MAEKNCKVCIVEGEVREPVIINNIIRIFFAHDNVKIITLPAGQNIYMLWKKLKADDFETDIIEVLRENNDELNRQLEGLERDDFSEIYLFFDYDGHQNNLGEAENGTSDDVLQQMLQSFDNETENGKLYISYPMVESLRDFEVGTCGRNSNCFVQISDICDYKNISASRAVYQHFKDYDYLIWKNVMEIFALKLSCLMNRCYTVSYSEYQNEITPQKILELENMEIAIGRVFVLSAFPEFLLDYFGKKLWITAVKRSSNELQHYGCRS
ncbi:MAG: hypothetical protein LUF27_09830 [Lachnospiraceae bacterium]|nr:hypothetical protein [Lachnospiraceae bacterium]